MAKPILYDPYGRPIERAALTQEIAAPTLTGVRSPIAGYPGDGLNPRRLASLLREADQGEPLRYFELAEQIEERDLHYAGVLGTRKRQVAQLEITVEAASDSADDVRRADMVRDWLTRDELQDELFDMLDAVGKGVSYTEIIWDTSEGQWRPGRLEWRDPRWFRPDRVDLRTPLLRSETGDVPLTPMKFICAVIRAKSGLPVRSGLARLATWSWMFKAYTQRDWAIFAQTFGQPIRVGKYGPGATEADKDTLFRAVANIAGDCAAIVPESMLIEFVESKNVGAGHQLYRERADWLDSQVSKAVLGQTGTTDATPGKLGGSDDHTQVREDIERADARSLAAVLNRDMVRPWVDLEEGPQQKYPKLRIGRPEDTDVDQVVKGIETLVPLGLRVEKSWAGDLLGIPDPDPNAELLAAPAQAEPLGGPGNGLDGNPLPRGGRQPSGPSKGFYPPSKTGLNASRGAAFHLAGQNRGLAAILAAALGPGPATAGTDEVDDLAAAAESVVAPGVDMLIEAIYGAVERAGSFEELRADLDTLALPKERFTELMRLVMVMAELSGRADIMDQAAADPALHFNPAQARGRDGRWSVTGSIMAAIDWLKGGDAKAALASVITQERARSAVALGIQSAMHAGGLEDQLYDQFIDVQLEHISATAMVAHGQARALMQAGVGKLIEVRRAMRGRLHAEDRVLDALLRLAQALERLAARDV